MEGILFGCHVQPWNALPLEAGLSLSLCYLPCAFRMGLRPSPVQLSSADAKGVLCILEGQCGRGVLLKVREFLGAALVLEVVQELGP